VRALLPRPFFAGWEAVVAEAPAHPSGLRAAGKSLWTAVWSELPATFEFDGRELAILGSACVQADTIAALERAIRRDGVTIAGSKGQRRLHPAIVEARQGRLALARLLGELQIPDVDARPMSSASQRAAKAARSRWAPTAELREARRG
jgi:hypothetical protein